MEHMNEHELLGEDNRRYNVDLFVDASFAPDLLCDDTMPRDKVMEIQKSLEGKIVEIELLYPTSYFAKNATLLD